MLTLERETEQTFSKSKSNIARLIWTNNEGDPGHEETRSLPCQDRDQTTESPLSVQIPLLGLRNPPVMSEP